MIRHFFYWDLLVSCGALPKARLAHTPKLKFKMSYVSRLDLFLASMRRIEYELPTYIRFSIIFFINVDETLFIWSATTIFLKDIR